MYFEVKSSSKSRVEKVLYFLSLPCPCLALALDNIITILLNRIEYVGYVNYFFYVGSMNRDKRKAKKEYLPSLLFHVWGPAVVFV